MSDLLALGTAVETGDRSTAARLTREALNDAVGPQAILDAMTAAMQVVGSRFQRNEIFVPEMLLAARAMKEATAVLEPFLVAGDVHPEMTAVLGTVQGDLHDIGKNLVGLMWKSANFEVIDLGTNVPPAQFAAAATEHDAQIVGVSALLTTTMVAMRDVVQAIRSANLAGVKVIVGGAPVTAAFAAEIGADGYAPDAGAAVDVARALVG